MNLIYIDIPLLIIFIILCVFFLLKNKKKVKREGIFFLYKTRFGLAFINKVSKKHSKILNAFSYISIIFGYVAMIAMFYILIYTLKLLFINPELRKIPAVAPFLPYVPQLFKLPVPEFIFIHWVIIIIIIAVIHEFSHGIFARLYKIKVKSTGFGFLGPIISAFVEIDEKQMARKNKKKQLAILSAGSFANFITGVLFLIMFILFLYASLFPSTIIYYSTIINVSDIKEINLDGISLNPDELKNIELEHLEDNKIRINTINQTYWITKELYEYQKEKIQNLEHLSNKEKQLIVYYNSPAINANIKGEILRVNNISYKDSRIFEEFKDIKVGDKFNIETSGGVYLIEAIQNPINSSRGFLGIIEPKETRGIIAKFLSKISPNKNPFMNYSPKYNYDIYYFFFVFFFWLLMACFGIALFNMLPFGFLDGGKFFFLTAFIITKSKKKSIILYRIINTIIILLFLIMIFMNIFPRII